MWVATLRLFDSTRNIYLLRPIFSYEILSFFFVLFRNHSYVNHHAAPQQRQRLDSLL
jgi:hypothetical protein